MKKAILCCALMLTIVMISEPHVRQWMIDSARSLMREGQTSWQEDESLSFSEQIGSHDTTDMLDVTLYYRFENTQTLGAQRAQLNIRREETVATSIVQRLIDGPAISYDRLHGLFPQGTQLVSVTGEDTTAFVTLTRGFLGKPDGAPADWEDSFAWQEEAALRRRMAVQSIVLSLTEGGRFQRVQMYVADSDDDIPERIPMYYFDPYMSDAVTVLAASPRDEAAMLTPRKAMEMILEAWKASDYDMLYALMAPDGENNLPSQNVFETQMMDRDISLLVYDMTDGTVSLDGQTATMVVNAQIRSREGGDALIIRESVPLVRVKDNWAITEDTLQSLMIRD